MKRLLSYVFLFFLTVSCTSELDQWGDRAQNRFNGDEDVFFASIEASTPDTKVFADEDMKILWNADDRISIFNRTTFNRQFAFSGEDGATAGSFRAVGQAEPGTAVTQIHAVYPYHPETTLSAEEALTVTLPAEQNYKAHSFGIGANAMVAVTDDRNLSFKNLGGYIAIRLYGDNISVSRITIRGNKGEKIAGKAAVTMATDGTPEATMDAAEATDAVSIVCTPAVKVGKSATSATDFWFVIPPTVFTEGFEITVVDNMGGVFRKKTTKSFTVKRNRLDRMSALKVEPEYGDVQIAFEDANFKAYCVDNFDTDHDGEISGDEAAVVRRIDVSTDNIRSIAGIEFFASLEQLSCTGSLVQTKGNGGVYGGQLERIDVSKNVHLWELDCSGNKIEEVDVSNNPALRTLICTDNPVKEVILAPDQVVATLESPVETDVVYEWEDAETPAPDEIWYTTLDGSLVSPAGEGFGDVTIVSNSYVDGKGIIKFSGAVTTIGEAAFYCSDALTSVTLPEGLTTIEGSAFDLCFSMLSITFPSTLTSLGGSAFLDCDLLSYVTLPESLTNIGDGAFSSCRSLKAFQGAYASADRRCLIKDGRLVAIAPSGLTTFTIPDGVTSIGKYSFYACANFTEITIPEGVREIGYASFGACSSLQSITIPESMTNIDEGAFISCSSLREFYGKFATEDKRCLVVGGTTVGFAPAGITEYTIPSGVTTIGRETFLGCDLTSITIPGSVQSIGAYAFASCRSLTSLVFESTTPPVLSGSYHFSNTNNCPLYVPASAVGTYKTAEGWDVYADRIVAIPSGITPDAFSDENFRAYVFQHFDTDGDGKISQAEAESVTRIEVNTHNITTLAGVEFFPNLTYLNCSGTSWNDIGILTQLDVSQNTALTYLKCNYNKNLSSLDVSNNTALVALYCFGNNLTTLDVSNNPALTYLDCGHSKLTSLDVSNNPALSELSCAYNGGLSSLDVSNNTALTELDCPYNNLSSLDVSNNTALTHLYCLGNNLTTLDVSNNTALICLDFRQNNLTTLDVSNNTALDALFCGENNLTTLDVSNNIALTHLDCGHSELITLDVSNNTALVYFDCSRNQLTSLDMSHNTVLKWLYCENNNLITLDVSNNPELTYLYCRGNSSLSELWMKEGQTITGVFAKDDHTVIKYKGSAVIHGAVDLGLPSGLKWATMNVGATKPEEYGDYFAWGETAPYYAEGHAYDSPCYDWKTGKDAGYGWENYRFRTSGDSQDNVKFSKYTTEDSYASSGVKDNKTTLEAEDDAASVNWGAGWRMPTQAEFAELINYCTNEWTSVNGVSGTKFTGPNGNSIFFPAAGYRDVAFIYADGSTFSYWSSSLYLSDYPYAAFCLDFNSGTPHAGIGVVRYHGLPVRPVKVSNDNESIGYDKWL